MYIFSVLDCLFFSVFYFLILLPKWRINVLYNLLFVDYLCLPSLVMPRRRGIYNQDKKIIIFVGLYLFLHTHRLLYYPVVYILG